MSDEEKVSKKKKVELDEDVLEMSDVYEQLAGALKDCVIPPTPDCVEAMAVSLLIDRRQKGRATAHADAQKAGNVAPSNASAGSAKNSENERECPICHTILTRKFKEGGSPRGYFSCKNDKVFVNDDGKTVPWSR